MSSHLERVLDIAADVTARRVTDLSSLRNIVRIDPARRTCETEPLVAFDSLVSATRELGFVPRGVVACEIVTDFGDVTRWRPGQGVARGIVTALTFELVPLSSGRARASSVRLGRAPRRARARRR